MGDVYIVFAKDPYEDNDRSLCEVFLNKKDATDYAMDRFSYTFGRASASEPFRSYRTTTMFDAYYEIEKFTVIDSYETPEWITSAIERREKEWSRFK